MARPMEEIEQAEVITEVCEAEGLLDDLCKDTITVLQNLRGSMQMLERQEVLQRAQLEKTQATLDELRGRIAERENIAGFLDVSPDQTWPSPITPTSQSQKPGEDYEKDTEQPSAGTE